MTRQQLFDRYNEIEIRTYQIADYVRQHGKDSLASQIDPEKLAKSDYFDMALQLACNGPGREAAGRFFDANIKAELEPEYQLLYEIMKEAVLGLVDGINPGVLVMKLNSYVDFGKKDAKFIYDKEMEYLKSKGLYEKELAKMEAFLNSSETKKPDASGGGPLSQDYVDALLESVDENDEKLKPGDSIREHIDEILAKAKEKLSAQQAPVPVPKPVSNINDPRYVQAKALYDSDKYDEAFPLLQTLANEGHAEARQNLGYCFYVGGGTAKDNKKALEWWVKSAGQGLAKAQRNVGNAFFNGEGVAQDYAQAIAWYSKAAEQGDADAQNTLGICYQDGYGVAQDYAKAVEWYQKAAERGCDGAQFNLGVCLHDGLGIAQDKRKAIEWWIKSAEQGNAEAQGLLKKLKMGNGE